VFLQYLDTVGWVLWPVKNCRPYNLYCVGGDIKPCSINQSTGRVDVVGGCPFLACVCDVQQRRRCWAVSSVAECRVVHSTVCCVLSVSFSAPCNGVHVCPICQWFEAVSLVQVVESSWFSCVSSSVKWLVTHSRPLVTTTPSEALSPVLPGQFGLKASTNRQTSL